MSRINNTLLYPVPGGKRSLMSDDAKTFRLALQRSGIISRLLSLQEFVKGGETFGRTGYNVVTDS